MVDRTKLTEAGKGTSVQEEQGAARHPDGALTAALFGDTVRSRKLDMGGKPLHLLEWTLGSVVPPAASETERQNDLQQPHWRIIY